MSALLVLVAAAAPTALAKTNYIDQGKFDADATASGVWQNINRVEQGGGAPKNGWETAAWPGKGYSYDVALSSANCQFTLVVDTHVFVVGAASALAVIDDEDDVSISGGMSKKTPYLPAFLGSETSDADCDTSVGPVVIDVHTSHGWGEPAPFGAVADVLSALEGRGSSSNGKKGPANYIDQGGFYTTADATRVAHNLNRLTQQISNGAAAAANCQAVIVVHSTLTVAALASADGTIEDGDKVTIMDSGDADAQMREYPPSEPPTMEDLLNNDHNATDSCSQPIESITITVKPHSDKIPPRS